MNLKIPDPDSTNAGRNDSPGARKTNRTTCRSYKPERVVRQVPHAYWIRFRRNGQAERTKRYWAVNPGQAFAKCRQEFRSAELIGPYRPSEYPGEKAITIYEAPSLVRIAAKPRPREKQIEFGFLEQISLNGPVLRHTGRYN
jgi:hypothetical protein